MKNEAASQLGLEYSNQSPMDSTNRFAFGLNWSHFLSVVDERRICAAEESLKSVLALDHLHELSFLDIGSGSGLSSLVAKRLGAEVHSFDFDAQSVACTAELKRRYFDRDPKWKIESGSVLDLNFMKNLGEFDIVYSWGVLHHTGAMWLGIEAAMAKVKPGGRLFIAIYNDQGFKSHIWWLVKWLYNRLPWPINVSYGYLLGSVTVFINIVRYTFKLKPLTAIRALVNHRSERGMSVRYDMLDWLGGFPFEFARIDVLKGYFQSRGLEVIGVREATSLGCHEIVLLKPVETEPLRSQPECVE